MEESREICMHCPIRPNNVVESIKFTMFRMENSCSFKSLIISLHAEKETENILRLQVGFILQSRVISTTTAAYF